MMVRVSLGWVRVRWLLGIWLVVATCALPLWADPGTGDFRLRAEDKAKIGRKIWANECGGSVDGLTFWSPNEEFPSLGIGHFIWYPESFQGPFEEGFPKLIAFAKKRGISPPAVALSAHCPWPNKAAFDAAFHGPELKNLRAWLSRSVGLQTDFIIERSRAALAKIMTVVNQDEARRVEANYHKVATTPQGIYALIDYVNFKGEGINPKEVYQGKGWGLRWVLLEMNDEVDAGPAAAREFAQAAKRVLDRRIAHSPSERGEGRWRQGWHNRCDGYTVSF